MKPNKSKLIPFSSPREGEAKKSLSDFIHMCRYELTIFSDHRLWRGWDSCKWPYAAFYKLSTSRKKKDQVEMDDNFIDFAKAYARHNATYKCRKISTILPCLKALEFAVVELDIQICDINKRTLDRAVDVLVETYQNAGACQSASYLRELADFLSREKMTVANIHNWEPNVVREDDMDSFVQKSEKEINKKIPNQAAMAGLVRVFSEQPKNPYDIVVTSLWAVLMSSGLRIREALSLSIDSLKIEHVDGCRVCYLQYYARKGGGWNKAPINEDMEPILIDAFNRIKNLTSESRRLAKHWEAEDVKCKNNPGHKRALPAAVVKKYQDNYKLSAKELAEIIGLGVNRTYKMLHKDSKMRILDNSMLGVQNWLNTYWDKIQPEGFPIFDKLGDSVVLKYSEALFCFRKYELSNSYSTANLIFGRFTSQNISPMLAGKQSFFVRHNIRGENGEIVKTNSHASRHLLNTIVQNVNLDQWDIARMFGRATPKHNKVYDHTSGYDRAQKSLGLTQNTDLFGGKDDGGSLDCKSPIDRVVYDQLNISPTTHSTEYGLCINNFAYHPCSKYRNCLSCSKHVIDTRDTEKIKQVKLHCQALKDKLAKANKKVGLVFGVESYIKHLTSELDETEQLVSAISNLDGQDARFLHRLGIKNNSCIDRAIDSIKDNMSTPIGVEK